MASEPDVGRGEVTDDTVDEAARMLIPKLTGVADWEFIDFKDFCVMPGCWMAATTQLTALDTDDEVTVGMCRPHLAQKLRWANRHRRLISTDPPTIDSS